MTLDGAGTRALGVGGSVGTGGFGDEWDEWEWHGRNVRNQGLRHAGEMRRNAKTGVQFSRFLQCLDPGVAGSQSSLTCPDIGCWTHGQVLTRQILTPPKTKTLQNKMNKIHGSTPVVLVHFASFMVR